MAQDRQPRSGTRKKERMLPPRAEALDPEEEDRNRADRARAIREELRDSRAKTIKGTRG